MELQVLDVHGRATAPLASRTLAAGRHRLALEPAGDAPLGPGIYFARLIVDGKAAAMRKFVRVR